MTIRTAPVLLCLLAALAATGCAKAPPDILLVTVDTLRADHLGVYGYGRETSPHLDAWSEEAVVFENAYSTSSWTVPAMASMTTGVEPPSHGVVRGTLDDGIVVSQQVLPEGLPTLAEELARRGYRTLGVSANGHLAPAFGFARGFERFEVLPFDSPAERVNRQLLEWRDVLDDTERPVFVWLHYCDPHFPYRRNDPYYAAWDPGATPEQIAIVRRIVEEQRVPPEVFAAPRHFLELALALYDSEIANWDAGFADLLRSAPRLAAAHTIVTADHGEEFLDHGGGSHGRNLYNETVRVPMLLRGAQTGAARIAAPVSLLDVPVTLLAWAGADAPEHWSGRPLPPTEPAEDGRELLAHLDRGQARSYAMRALIGPRFKVILSERGVPLELYDLAADPAEQRNLAALDADRAHELAGTLKERMAALPAPPGEAQTATVDAETARQLRAVGYLGN